MLMGLLRRGLAMEIARTLWERRQPQFWLHARVATPTGIRTTNDPDLELIWGFLRELFRGSREV